MNYRHAYHAGNVADVMKHVLLSRIITHLLRKPAPFRVIDTHAGIGLYDLGGVEATKTAEWQAGIGRMDAPFDADIEALLGPWREIIARVRTRYGAASYPGSPMLTREMLRPEDRAIFVEKHPEDVARLAGRLRRVSNVKVVHLDGWTALGGFIPPKERRGLVLIDPPFEEPGEFARSADRLLRAVSRWTNGVYALWYPVKHMPEIEAFAARLAQDLTVPTLRLELRLAPADGSRLAGSGLVVVNPPWTLADEARAILPALAGRFDSTIPSLCQELVASA